MYVEKAYIFFIPLFGILWYNHMHNKVKNVKCIIGGYPYGG